jgi:hypothetical protein
MKKQQKIKFYELSKFIKGLPSQLIGEVFQALIETMGKKYGPEEFELVPFLKNRLVLFL